MKHLEGAVTLIIRKGGMYIEIEDVLSSITICRVTVNAENTLRLLSNQGAIKCELIVSEEYNKIGKKLEVGTHEFEIPNNNYETKKDLELLDELANITCTAGWTPDKYYGSQNSFFTKNGKNYARVTIRRWI